MRLVGTPEELIVELEALFPGAAEVAARAQEIVPYLKRQIWPWQAAALYSCARRYDRAGALILEIGTAWGYSACVLSLAAPRATIVTLNPKSTEYPYAVKHLAGLSNVAALEMRSEEYLAQSEAQDLDMVFIDGDHTVEGVRADCRFWDVLKPGGLLLFHDYSPAGAKRPSPTVKQAVDEFGAQLGRGPDVLIQDTTGTGMAGWYRR